MSTFGPRIEPDFFKQDAILKLQQTAEGRSAILLLLELRARCFETLSDGFVPTYGLKSATAHPDPEQGVEMLIVVGLAAPAENAVGEPGWLLDWSTQLKAETVRKKRKDNADWDRHLNGNHRECAGHKGYNCHKNGDYKKWLTEHPEDLGNPAGDLADDPAGNRLDPSTRLDSTRYEVERGEEEKEIAPTVAHSGAGAPIAPSVAPQDENGASEQGASKNQTGAPTKRRTPKHPQFYGKIKFE